MTQAKLPIILGVVVALAGAAAGVALLRTHARESAEQPMPMPVPVQTAPALPIRTDPQVPSSVTTPIVTPIPASTPAPSPPETPSALRALLVDLNAELPKLGVPPPAQLTAATMEKNLLVLTFSAAFQPQLTNRSALDELTAALSSRAQARGYRNLDLRLIDSLGRVRSIAELITTPPARRPRPEPIDDGVRR